MSTKADDNGPFKEFKFDDWLRENISCLRSEIKHKKEQANRTNFRNLLRTASKDQLMTMRNLIDNAIEQIDKQQAREPSPDQPA